MSPKRSLAARLAEVGAALAGTLGGAALIRRLGGDGPAATPGAAPPDPPPDPPTATRAHTAEPRSAVRALDARPPTPATQPRTDRTGSGSPPPAHPALPRPTYWPAALAFGMTLLAWGFVTTVIISAVGLLVICVAIGGWIGELLHEHEARP